MNSNEINDLAKMMRNSMLAKVLKSIVDQGKTTVTTAQVDKIVDLLKLECEEVAEAMHRDGKLKGDDPMAILLSADPYLEASASRAVAVALQVTS